MFSIKIHRMVDFLSVVNTFLIASSNRNEVIYEKTVLALSKAEDNIISSKYRLGIKSKSNCKTVICKKKTNRFRTKTTNGTSHYTLPCIYTVREVHSGMLFGSKRYDTSIQSFKMARNFEPETKFFTSRERFEKQKQQNEYSNKGKKHINRSYYVSMNVDEHIFGFFVKNYLESFCDAINLLGSLLLFHCSDYNF